jgi:hypothetical protein
MEKYVHGLLPISLERRDGAALLQRSKKEGLPRDYGNKRSESPETPVFGSIDLGTKKCY